MMEDFLWFIYIFTEKWWGVDEPRHGFSQQTKFIEAKNKTQTWTKEDSDSKQTDMIWQTNKDEKQKRTGAQTRLDRDKGHFNTEQGVTGHNSRGRQPD